MMRFARLHRGFGFRHRQLRAFHRGGERVDVAEIAGLLGELLLLGLDARKFLIEPRQAVAMGAHTSL